MKQSNTIFEAEMRDPMGKDRLRIYEDNTFQFERRRLMKSTFYEGTVTVDGKKLLFAYSSSAPDFGAQAIIDGIFLTYPGEVYNEVLEISLNNLPHE